MTREEGTIQALQGHIEALNETIEKQYKIIQALEQQSDDAISSQVVKEQMLKYGFHAPDMTVTEFIEDLPPVQPKYNTDEWCHDCKEYDQDKHCCPRFNRVIRNAVKEIKQPNIDFNSE